MTKIVELLGQRFGRLVVTGPIGFRKAKGTSTMTTWVCKCDCGLEKEILSNSLRRGRSNSCGKCKDKPTKPRKPRSSYLRATWWDMIYRCHNPKCHAFKDYGGRGITVCDRWRNSFKSFLEDMGPKPTPKHWLERSNNELGYSPENCCWSTRQAGVSNTRRNVKYPDPDGKMVTVSEIARQIGWNFGKTKKWLSSGCSVEDLLEFKQDHEKTIALDRVTS